MAWSCSRPAESTTITFDALYSELDASRGEKWGEVLFPVTTSDFTPFAQAAVEMKPDIVVGHYGSGQNLGVIPALRRLYAPDVIHRVLEPVAVASWRSRLVDKRCNHTDCDCLWCRHGRHDPEINEQVAPAVGGSMNEARRLSCVK